MTPKKEAWARLLSIKEGLEQRGMTPQAADLWHRYLRHDMDDFNLEGIERAIKSFQEDIDNYDWLQERVKARTAAERKSLPTHLLPPDVARRLPYYQETPKASSTLIDVKARGEMSKALRMLRTADMTDRQREQIDKFQTALRDAYQKAYIERLPPPEYPDWKTQTAEDLFNRWAPSLPDELYTRLFHADNEPFLLWLMDRLNAEFSQMLPGVYRYTKAPPAYDFAFTETVETFEIPKGESQIMDGSWRKVRISSARNDLDFLVGQQANRNASGGYGLSEEDPRDFVKREHAKIAQERAEDEALMAWRERAKTMTPEEIRQHQDEIVSLGFYGARGRRLYDELMRDAQFRKDALIAERRRKAAVALARRRLEGWDDPANVVVRMRQDGETWATDEQGKIKVISGVGPIKVPVMVPWEVLGHITQITEWGVKTDTGWSSSSLEISELARFSPEFDVEAEKAFYASDQGYIQAIAGLSMRPDPFYPPETPIEVWKAGAPYATVQRHVIQGEPLYGWPIPYTHDREWKVIRANGTTVPKNSRKHQEFVDIAYVNRVNRK